MLKFLRKFGVLQEIKVKEGEVVTADQLVAVLIEGEVAAADAAEVDSATTNVSMWSSRRL